MKCRVAFSYSFIDRLETRRRTGHDRDVNRISRTEFEKVIKFVDSDTGTPVAFGYTGLWMGANYAWPRSAKWLMEQRVMAKLPDK